MNHFSLTIVQINIFEEPPNPNQNPRPQTIEPAPRIFNYRVSPWELGRYLEVLSRGYIAEVDG